VTSERVDALPTIEADRDELAVATAAVCGGGRRFAGLFNAPREDGRTRLEAVVHGRDGYSSVVATLPVGDRSYPSLSRLVPAAAWYERELHDRYGLRPVGHPRLDPLVLPRRDDGLPPLAFGHRHEPVVPDTTALDAHASGEGMFTIPYGPVRSGVFETVEYLVETFGEDIPRLRSRLHHKHRGVDVRFEDLSPEDGVLLAERVEGTASVAHAWTYSRAIEELTATEVPLEAEHLRVAHAELERVVNHLESMIRHTEGSYQAVANARLAVHKERVMRLRSALCGNRFGRNVVIPGGVQGPPRVAPAEAAAQIASIGGAFAADAKALMVTPSFLDRLRGTGVLAVDLVADHGALGPVGRASGAAEDIRSEEPYGTYRALGFAPGSCRTEGDALARQRVRVDEVQESFRLATAALEAVAAIDRPSWWRPVERVPDGRALAAVEAPQGELLYLVEARDGRLTRVRPRCAAFHNFALFPRAFGGDILTDFVFIEASFGLSIAGVAG